MEFQYQKQHQHEKHSAANFQPALQRRRGNGMVDHRQSMLETQELVKQTQIIQRAPLTIGQQKIVKKMNKHKYEGFNADRLAKAIGQLIRHNKKEFSLITQDKQLQRKMDDIVEELDIRPPTGWKDELK